MFDRKGLVHGYDIQLSTWSGGCERTRRWWCAVGLGQGEVESKSIVDRAQLSLRNGTDSLNEPRDVDRTGLLSLCL